MDDKKHSSAENNPDSGDKALWDLLGHGRKTEAGPMFSRNVVREVRLSLDDESKSAIVRLFEWLSKPAFLATGAATLLLIGGLYLLQIGGPKPLTPDLANLNDPMLESIEMIDPAEEFESIERLGELMAVTDPGVLSDEALMSLLF